MIHSFTKLDGLRIGIDLETIVDVTENMQSRIIGTLQDEYEVLEDFNYIMGVVNNYKNSFVIKFYNN